MWKLGVIECVERLSRTTAVELFRAIDTVIPLQS